MNSKPYFRVMEMEGMEIVPIFLHHSSTPVTTTLSPFSPYASLLMHTMWHFSW